MSILPRFQSLGRGFWIKRTAPPTSGEGKIARKNQPYAVGDECPVDMALAIDIKEERFSVGEDGKIIWTGGRQDFIRMIRNGARVNMGAEL